MLQIIWNLVAVLLEFGLIAGVAALAVFHPWWLAGGTIVLIMLVGAMLEWARQRHELPFYFEKAGSVRMALAGFVGIIESLVKAVAGGAAIILTFAGGDRDRALVMAVILAVCLVIGCGVVRRGFYASQMRPARWGFFRLAVPLGVLFSLGVQAAIALAFIKIPSFRSLAGTLVFDVPARPSVSQLSDLAFNLRQMIDALVADVATQLLGSEFAAVLSVVVSINVLIGFALAIYVVVIMELVLRVEGGRRR